MKSQPLNGALTRHRNKALLNGRPAPNEIVLVTTGRDLCARPARVVEHLVAELYRVELLADYDTERACKEALRRLTRLGCRRKRNGRRVAPDGEWLEVMPLSGEDGRGLIRIKTSNDRELTAHVSEGYGMIVRSALALLAGLSPPWWVGEWRYVWSLDAVAYAGTFCPYRLQDFR